MTTIVMTGGSSGFGALAAEQIVRRHPGTRLEMASRTPMHGSAPVDLTRLDSVRAFAASVKARLGPDAVDALVLNAGAIRADDAGRTVDGFETTFVVDHLAHYLLLRLLLSTLADGARVIFTTSGTHNPATRVGLATPRHAEARLLAHPDRDPDRMDASPRRQGQHAYTAAKLCNILTVRALSADPDTRSRGITAIAYDPGQVFGTGLARSLPRPLRIAWSVLGSPLGAPFRRFSRTWNSRSAAGE